jgi:hypothetical protein
LHAWPSDYFIKAKSLGLELEGSQWPANDESLGLEGEHMAIASRDEEIAFFVAPF